LQIRGEAPVITRDVQYEVDGTTMIGRLALPDGDGTRPGVLIAHEGNGLDDFQKERAEQFAALGYVAFALDYYGGGTPLTDRDDINARLTRLWDDAALARSVAQAGLDVLLAEPRTDATRVAAVGYCFGGALVLELARGGAELKAVVGFHPGLRTPRPQDSAAIRGAVLICIGADDPLVGVDQRNSFEAEMRGAGGRLAHVRVRRRAAQLHPPGRRRQRPARSRVRPSDRRTFVARDARPVRRDARDVNDRRRLGGRARRRA
jgi:dienelactone hydrolase